MAHFSLPPTLQALQTAVGQALQPVCLSEAHCWAETRLLLEGIGLSAQDILLNPAGSLSDNQRMQLTGFLERRITGREPVQYILGRAHFYGLALSVSPAVLIPRPETETLVEAALAHCQAFPPESDPLRIVDVATGSGAIALALYHELTQEMGRSVAMTATDLSPDALAVARANAGALGYPVEFYEGDGLGALSCEATSPRYHLIVSNPPYVDPVLRETLQPEVVAHEPAMALFPPGDRLAFYRRLAEGARKLLRPGGALMVEIGDDQGPAVRDIFSASGYQQVRVVPDLAGRDRVVTGIQP
ncbi:MAG: peptide chain release factor N(5)-glutamine methyltransferase [Candidatus Melainabacteria bacterium]